MKKICRTRDDLLIVFLLSDLDHHVTEQIRSEIDEQISTKRIFRLAFDFRNVGFMDSSGIGLIMGRYKKIQPMGGEIYICNLSYSMQRIFKMSGLYKITKHSFEVDHIVNEEVLNEQNEDGI